MSNTSPALKKLIFTQTLTFPLDFSRAIRRGPAKDREDICLKPATGVDFISEEPENVPVWS